MLRYKTGEVVRSQARIVLPEPRIHRVLNNGHLAIVVIV